MADRIDLDALEKRARRARRLTRVCDSDCLETGGHVVAPASDLLALVRAVRAARALSHGNRSNPAEVTLWNVRIDNLNDFDDAMEPFRKEETDG